MLLKFAHISRTSPGPDSERMCHCCGVLIAWSLTVTIAENGREVPHPKALFQRFQSVINRLSLGVYVSPPNPSSLLRRTLWTGALV